MVIAESTRKLVGNLFQLDELGAQDLKGISGRVSAWAAVRAASVESRFDALHATGLTELVGREEELDLLLRRWSKAKGSEGQVVLLSGEPGIGKSRLTAALLERIAAEAHTRLRYFCSPQHTDSALHPIINQMERAAGLTHDDNTQARLEKLDALLAKSLTPPPRTQHCLVICSHCRTTDIIQRLNWSHSNGDKKRWEALTAQARGAVEKQASADDSSRMCIGSNPTSLEALGRIVERLRTLGAAADRHLSAGVRAALGRQAPTLPHSVSIGSVTAKSSQ